MKIVLAPDSFKGSATAMEVCQAMAAGIREAMETKRCNETAASDCSKIGTSGSCNETAAEESDLEITMAPVADGGEGTVENLVTAYNGESIEIQVTGPAGEPVKARYGIIKDDLCIIEAAESSGLVLLSEDQRDPLKTTTYGFGELINDALSKGCKTFVIGLGGSGTNDGGCGMAQALGYELLDEEGKQIGFGGGSLDQLACIKTDNINKKISEATFMIACDVNNPLCGPTGASYVFGPQKGASPEAVEILDRNLRHLADIIKRDLGKDVSEIPGAGAAGGLGAGTMAFLNGSLQDGFGIISGLLELEEKIADADLVFTGEGQCDFQTLRGKAPYGVVSLAKKAGVPSIIIAGSVGKGVEAFYEMGVADIIGIKTETMTLDFAKSNAKELISCAACDALKKVKERGFICSEKCVEKTN